MEDIREDIRVAQRSLDRDGYLKWKEDEWLHGEGSPKNTTDNSALAPKSEAGVGQKDAVGISQME